MERSVVAPWISNLLFDRGATGSLSACLWIESVSSGTAGDSLATCCDESVVALACGLTAVLDCSVPILVASCVAADGAAELELLLARVATRTASAITQSTTSTPANQGA